MNYVVPQLIDRGGVVSRTLGRTHIASLEPVSMFVSTLQGINDSAASDNTVASAEQDGIPG